MRLHSSILGFSATDLAHFSACGQRTLLDRLKALGEATPQVFPDPRLDLLRERGQEHERRYLESVEAEGKRVARVAPLEPGERGPDGWARRRDQTRALMAKGPDVIYQGVLYDGTWLGFADFLLRVERPSELGAWSYEVVDAKLAREARASAVLQTCLYSDLLEGMQGVVPEHVHLFLGGPEPRMRSYRLAHFAAYYRALRRRFEAHVADAPPEPPVAPEPVELCQVCPWKSRCRAERVETDHLSLVAGIARDHHRALDAHGVTTLQGLAHLPLTPTPEGLRTTGFQRIREQARVQLEGRERGEPYHEILPIEVPEEGRPPGLAALPEPCAHDLFFDIEGADYAYEEGLEYLFGISDAEDAYQALWALRPDEEKAVLDVFLAETLEHVRGHPEAHVYHFGHYEPSRLKRLVGRYGVGTDALDELLRREAFVDLHRIVKQAVRASVESYSLKAMEPFYGFEREVPLEEATPGRVRVELALAYRVRDVDALAEDRRVVEGYNRDDCVSTRALRDWLEELRTEVVAGGTEVPRPPPGEDGSEAEDELGEVQELMDALLDGVSEEPGERTPEEHHRWLVAHLLEWHRREDKSAWWEYFRLRDLTEDELIEETRPLAGLDYEGVVDAVKQSDIHRFRYPPQEHRISSGRRAKDSRTEKGRHVRAIDELARTVDLKVGKNTSWDPTALRVLLPDEIVRTKDQRERLRETARCVLEGVEVLGAWSPASRALLLREAPTFGGGAALPDVAPGGSILDRAREAALTLRSGVLPVHGPPGTGKTYCGARMIRALLRDGTRVGVTGPSHKVITNLLNDVCRADEDDPRTDIRGVQVGRAEHCEDDRFVRVKGGGDLATAMARRSEERLPPFNLFAGTAWLWSRGDIRDTIDILVIDEAGQYSLANALAVAPAAPRLVLLGDPQQLDQPQKGIHPSGTEVSVLEHLAGDDGMLMPEQGLFLGETWRMRPEITSFTSELFYGGKLRARPDLVNQRLTTPGGEVLRGLHLREVPHTGNARESAQEAEAVLALFGELLAGDGTFTDRHGQTRPLALGDLLVVAPYNAQVSRIQRELADAGYPEAQVGTVDKFQGQEAPVAVYSMASSSAADAPRGMGFLYALDRLNVATSRARCATVVVASPALFTAGCRRPQEMRMVNALVRFGEMAGEGTGRPTLLSQGA